MSEHDNGKKCFRARVEGRVQGVGFRYFVARKAESLGVFGWVRNRWDGSVEIEAEGDEVALQQLTHWVRRGPPGSFVSDLQVKWNEPTGEQKKFKIRRTG
jgi:acylphosphatase